MPEYRNGDCDEVRLKLRVRGRVQGVFFRAATRERARALGIVGWVRNCDDGSVEIEAQGGQKALEQLAAWARRGPEDARVDAVEIAELEPVSPSARETAFRVSG